MNMLIRFFIMMALLKAEHKASPSPDKKSNQHTTQPTTQNAKHNTKQNTKQHTESAQSSTETPTNTSATQTQQQLFDPIIFNPVNRHYRILPHDMGFRNHLPNYRYLSFIELNITYWLTQLAYQQNASGLRWIISMQEVVYLKEVKFLDKLSVKSTLEGWDEKYVYFQHHFMVKNTLMAIGMTKFILINRQRKVAPSEFGLQESHTTEVIETWNHHQTAIKSQ